MRTLNFKYRMLGIAFTIAVLLVSLYTRNGIHAFLIQERRRDADTAVQLFCENLKTQLDSINYASKMTYTLDAAKYSDLKLFEKTAKKLLKQHSHIRYLSYFEGDSLTAIYPKEKYKAALGNDMHDLSYSYTLAKVVKEGVIAGPEQLSLTKENVFLFIEPLLTNGQYKGEVVAAVDSDYVLDKMHLDFLTDRRYDYELWRVNALGEKKTIIQVSNASIDFSDAAKLEFSLPATWNLSIQPSDGWLPADVKLLIDGCCAVGALLILGCAYLLIKVIRQKNELQKAAYTDPDSGLLNREGFCYYVDRSRYMQSSAAVTLLYIQLHNFHRLCRNVSRQEVLIYLHSIRDSLQERFSLDSIAARLSDEEIAVAIFEDTQNEKAMEQIEDFILQLFWKKKFHGKKEFVEPKSCIIRSTANQTTAEELLKNAVMRLNELYDLQTEERAEVDK